MREKTWRTAVALVLAALALGCAGAQGRRATLERVIDGRPFPAPVVRGTVAGTPTWLVLDTGASTHAIAGWLARRLKLPTVPGGGRVDAVNGAQANAERVEHPRVAIAGWGELDDAPMRVLELPDDIEKLGVGAFISPQLLARGATAVVLDLPGREMRAAPFDDAVADLTFAGTLLTKVAPRVCYGGAEAPEAMLYVVPATLDGEQANLVVDTGAQNTTVALVSSAGAILAARGTLRERYVLGLSIGSVRVADKVRVSVGERTVVTEVNITPSFMQVGSDCPFNGLVGMDLLERCVLVLGAKTLVGRCRS